MTQDFNFTGFSFSGLLMHVALNPVEVASDVGVNPRFAPLGTACAPADNATDGGLASLFTYQGPTRISLKHRG